MHIKFHLSSSMFMAFVLHFCLVLILACFFVSCFLLLYIFICLHVSDFLLCLWSNRASFSSSFLCVNILFIIDARVGFHVFFFICEKKILLPISYAINIRFLPFYSKNSECFFLIHVCSWRVIPVNSENTCKDFF